MSFKILYTNIKKLSIKLAKIVLLILNWGVALLIAVLSLPIWLPIVTWKTGLIISDHVIKYIVND